MNVKAESDCARGIDRLIMDVLKKERTNSEIYVIFKTITRIAMKRADEQCLPAEGRRYVHDDKGHIVGGFIPVCRFDYPKIKV